MNNKFLTKEKIIKLKQGNKKIVLCHGVFDLFHFGHLNHINEAKKYGDILIISLTTDRYVNKGPGRPFFDLEKRMNVMAAIENVDYVISSDAVSGESIINKIKPDIYFKGPDYVDNKNDFTGFIKKEISAVKRNKGKIIYSVGDVYSSSVLINKISNFNNDQKKIIDHVNKNYSFSIISKEINKKIKKLKILLIGEMIIDRFVFCAALGKSGKESILNLEKQKTIDIVGGVGAVANHLSDFAKKINIVTYLGSYNDKIKFIKKDKKKNIILNYIKKDGSPTIVKTKIIDSSNNLKLLGLYEFNDKLLLDEEEKLFFSKIRQKINSSDIVMVSDYGHGLISPKISKFLSKKRNSIFNTQLNSGNYGYHTIGKYKNSEWAVINEVELRHELRDRYSDIKQLMFILSKKLHITNLIVTAGKNGSYYCNSKDHQFIHCPAFATNIIDKIGAGDSFMAIFGIMNYCFPKDIRLSLFLASLGVVQVLEGFGNEKHIKLTDFLKALKYILK
jgi:rfaE bifunctional protein nucleotidyltransferase chain/domain